MDLVGWLLSKCRCTCTYRY